MTGQGPGTASTNGSVPAIAVTTLSKLASLPMPLKRNTPPHQQPNEPDAGF